MQKRTNRKGKSGLYSENEWSPLKEVIVGRVDHAVFPAWDIVNKKTCPQKEWAKIRSEILQPGDYYPADRIKKAKKALANLIKILKKEGVKVYRPDDTDFKKRVSTRFWSVETGFCSASPRDILMIVGNKLILAPTVDRTRHDEWKAYERLIENFRRRNIHYVVAKRPLLKDSLYNELAGKKARFAINNSEPVFDAADFTIAGNDIFVQESNVTNKKGIALFRNLVGKKYKVHVLKNKDRHAMHIDVVFVPIAEKTALVNPHLLDLKHLPKVLSDWRLLVPPRPAVKPLKLRGFVHDWIGINVLSLDGRKIIVEKREKKLMDFLRKEGFKPIPCDFADYYALGGGLHCSTLDIGRVELVPKKDDHWGQLTILDLSGCDKKVLKSKTLLKKFALDLCRKIDMKAHGNPMVERFGRGNIQGNSVMLFIETSSITIHADEVGKRVFIDVFSCKEFDAGPAKKFAKEFFKANQMKSETILR